MRSDRGPEWQWDQQLLRRDRSLRDGTRSIIEAKSRRLNGPRGVARSSVRKAERIRPGKHSGPSWIAVDFEFRLLRNRAIDLGEKMSVEEDRFSKGPRSERADRKGIRLQDAPRFSFGRRTLVLRAIWGMFRWIFWLPRPFSPLRVMLLRFFGSRIGRGALIMPGVRIWMPWNFEAGDYCALGRGAEIYNFGKVKLGNQVLVSQGAYLCTASHDHRDATMPLVYEGITLGSGSWVAADAFIGPGSVIGDGAVVGARAVVRGEVAPWAIVIGNPAVQVGYRKLREDA